MRIFIFLCSIFLLTSSLDAQICYCCGCRHYMDLTQANYDGNYYGYVDNINYPDPYALPINIQFNYCPPCPCNSYNTQYIEGCIHYTNNRYSSEYYSTE